MNAGPEEALRGLRPLGHGTVLVALGADGPPRIAVDPWRWREADSARADLVLVTDGRIDHASPEDAALALREGGTVVAPASAAARLAEIGARVVPATEGAVLRGPDLGLDADVLVRVLPSAAPSRAAGFLPRGAGATYLVEGAGRRLLFLGASDALSEHEGLAPDVLFVAVGEFTTLGPDEAADAAARVRPRVAVPTHWGDLSGRFASARRFAELCRARGVAAAEVAGDSR